MTDRFVESLKVTGGQKVKKVTVTTVTVYEFLNGDRPVGTVPDEFDPAAKKRAKYTPAVDQEIEDDPHEKWGVIQDSPLCQYT